MPKTAPLSFRLLRTPWLVGWGVLGSVASLACGSSDASRPPAVGQIIVFPDTVTLTVGNSRALTADVRSTNGVAITGQGVVWTVSDTNVLGVRGDTVTARLPGTSIVIASVGSVRGSAYVVVIPVPVTSITINQDTMTLVVGQSTQLTAQARDSAGGLLMGRAVTWTSSDTARATVSSTGLVTARKAGSVSVTATLDGQSARLDATVIPRITTSVPDTIHTMGLYAGVTIIGWQPTRDESYPRYAVDTARMVVWQPGVPGGYVQLTDSTWTLFVSQRLATGPHTLTVTAGGAILTKRFTVVRDDTARYAILALPTLGGTNARGADINQDGVVSGWAEDASSVPHAVTWTGGVVQRLGDAGSSRATALNQRGRVVGVAQDPRMTRPCLRPVIWENGSAPRLLPAYPSTNLADTAATCVQGDYQWVDPCYPGYCPRGLSMPLAINNNGSILTRSSLVVGGATTALLDPTQRYLVTWSLNNNDQAAISTGLNSVPGYGEAMVAFGFGLGPGTLPGDTCYRWYESVATLTDRSRLVGTRVCTNTRVFEIDSAGRGTDLSSITGDLRANAANNLGEIILSGAGLVRGGDSFILKGTRLFAIAPVQSGWSNFDYLKINDAGLILATATSPSGVTTPVLLTPIP